MSRRLAPLRRSLDVMPSPVEDRPGLLLRDPFGYTGRGGDHPAAARAVPAVLRRRARGGGPRRRALPRDRRRCGAGLRLAPRRDAGRQRLPRGRGARAPAATRATAPSPRRARREPSHAGRGLPGRRRRSSRALLDGWLRPRRADEPRRRRACSRSPRRTSASRAASARTPPRTRALPADAGERTFVVLGTSHYGAPERFGLTRKPYVTPFGAARTDTALVDRLVAAAGGAAVRRGLLPRGRALDRVPGGLPPAPASAPAVRDRAGPVRAVRRAPRRGRAARRTTPASRASSTRSRSSHAREGRRLAVGARGRHGARRPPLRGRPRGARRARGRSPRWRSATAGGSRRSLAGDADGFWERGPRERGRPQVVRGLAALRVPEGDRPRRGALLRYEQWNIDPASVVSFAALAFGRGDAGAGRGRRRMKGRSDAGRARRARARRSRRRGGGGGEEPAGRPRRPLRRVVAGRADRARRGRRADPAAAHRICARASTSCARRRSRRSIAQALLARRRRRAGVSARGAREGGGGGQGGRQRGRGEGLLRGEQGPLRLDAGGGGAQADQGGPRPAARRASGAPRSRASCGRSTTCKVLLEPYRVPVELGDAPVRGNAKRAGHRSSSSRTSSARTACARGRPSRACARSTATRCAGCSATSRSSFHEQAEKAGEAAACAGDQGKFWEMHDQLWANATKLEVARPQGARRRARPRRGRLRRSASTPGRHAGVVERDLEAGQGYGVSGTPAFFVNGRPLVGAQPFEAFQQVIDDELQRAGPRRRAAAAVSAGDGPPAAGCCAGRSASRRSRRRASRTRATRSTASATRSCASSRSRWPAAARAPPRTRRGSRSPREASVPDAEGGRARGRLPRRRAAARARGAHRRLDASRAAGRTSATRPAGVAERETREESGYAVRARKLIAVFDKSRHEHPPSLYYTYKMLVLCDLVGGEARESHETDGVGFFRARSAARRSTSSARRRGRSRSAFAHPPTPTLPTDFD